MIPILIVAHDCIALKRIMENEGMDLEIIVNPKTTDDGQSVIQVTLEIPTFDFFITLMHCLLYSWRQPLAPPSSTLKMPMA